MRNIYSLFVATLLCCSIFEPCMYASESLSDDSAKLFGLVHWDGKKTTNKGVASIPTDPEEWTGNLDYVWTIKTYPYNYGGCHFEDKYYCNFLRIMDGYILEQKAYIYDDKTGEELDVIQLPTAFDLYDGAYYEPEEIIYAFVRDMSTGGYGWARVNPRNAEMKIIKEYPTIQLYGVVITDEGQAYGISGDGGFYSIDRTSGDATLIFRHEDLETKTVPKAHTGAAWDEDNQRIVFAVCNLEKDGGSRLFSVDPSRKTVELLYKFDGLGTQLTGLYFERSLPPYAPSAPTDLKVEFDPGSLTGSLKFTLPSTSIGGGVLTGDVNYVLKIDGEKVKEGSGKSGTPLDIEINVAQAGWHTFHVTCSNESGRGLSAKIERFAGYEAPLAPSDFTARHYGGKMHLAWTLSQETGIKGGPVNVETIQYVIKSNHGDEFITDPGADSYEFSIPDPDEFTPWYFTIAAQNADGMSKPVVSNNVPLGVVKGSYTQDFSQESSKYQFTTVDANNDGTTWEWSESGLMVIRYNVQQAMDDYLTLPPINMEYGEFYVMEFDAAVYNFEEEIEVKLAEDYNQKGMEDAVTVYGPVTLPVNELRKESWTHHDVLVQAPDDNKFFMSIHGISPADRNVILIDNVSLRTLAGGDVPAAVCDLKAVPDSKGKSRVTLSGTIPDKDVAGNPVSSVEYLKITRNGLSVATVPVNGATTFEWVDENASKGENNYVVTTGNSTGDGLNARCSAFTGFVTPNMPENCEIRYSGSDYDSIEFSWSPVMEDLNGRDVSDAVAYDIIRSLDGDMSFVARGQRDSRILESFKNLSEPLFVQYGVYAVVDGKNGDMITSEQIPVGPAYDLPLTEGFQTEIKMAYGLNQNLSSEDSGLFTTNDSEKYQSADGDGGYGVFIGKKSGESATLYTAWLSIAEDAVEPVASIQYFGEGDVIANLIHIGTNVNIADGFKLEKSIETGGMGWQTAVVNLDQYRGQDVRLALKFETVGNTYLRFDDFKVYDKGISKVSEILDTEDFSISSGSGWLDIKCADDVSVEVYSIEGMKIHKCNGSTILNLNPDIYVIVINGMTTKVKVK